MGLVLAALCACGRVGFDARNEADGGDPICTTDCFPRELYRGAAFPSDWGTAASVADTGQVHIAYIDPALNTAFWQHSDVTYRRWSTPTAIVSGGADSLHAVILVKHADDTVSALVLAIGATTSTLYRTSIERGSGWTLGPVSTLPMPAVPAKVTELQAVADSGAGGFVVALTEGSAMQTNALFAARSPDKFQTLQAFTNVAPWEQVASATTSVYFLEARVAADSSDDPWLYYHSRSVTSDDGIFLRLVGASWQSAMPAFGDPWHPMLVVDERGVLHVIYDQEGTSDNPQHATGTDLASVSGGVAMGNWPWSALPSNANVRSGHAHAPGTLRVAWENPQAPVIALRELDTTGNAWGPIHDDVVGAVVATTDGTDAALTVAPQLVAGTSHVLWRDIAADEFVVRYSPVTICSGTLCRADEGCIGGSCVAR
jgi:hypothetical protein